MTIIEKIKTEIERRISISDLDNPIGLWSATALTSLLSFLSTLESEKPMQKELEEEIDRFEDWMETYNQADYPTSFTTRDIARHFAKWQKEQDEISKVNYEGARAVYDNTVQHLQEKIDEKYELGKKDMKEQMLKKAVEGVLVDNVDGTQEICLHGNRYGEKVRIIIVKDNEK